MKVRGGAAALIVATAFAPWPVLAQQVEAGGRAEQRDVAELDAIVVTAQKRSERLQDVPIAIETLGEAALAAGPVTDITAIQLVSPAVSGSGNSSAQPLIAVRGIVSNDFSIGADPALGIYVDDVYTGRSAGAVQELVDIDRVEIVKGPQGTLFGRNTTAGAISIYTNRPDLAGFSGSAVTSIGDFDAVRASTTVNLPLDDQTAVRASMVYDRHDGFFENAVGGRRLDKADHLAGRAALRFETGTLDVILTGEYERDRDDGLVAKSIAYPIAGDEGFAKAKPPVSINAPIRNHRDLYGGNLRIEGSLGSLNFTSISAVRGYRVRYLEDTDATPLTQVHFGSREWQDAQSQEFRLASPYQAFRWTAGASIYHERIAADSRTIYDEDGVCTGLARSPTPTDCDSLLRALPSPDPSAANLFDALFAAGAVTDPYTGETGQIESNRARGEYLSFGVYGDFTLELTPTFSLTGGLRYSRDRKSVNVSSLPTANLVTLVNEGNLYLRSGQQQASKTWDQWQPRVVLAWKPLESLSAYASYTRGYKSGGFNVLQPGDPPFGPERVSQIEAGLKGSLLERRLRYDFAAFQWRYNDLQVQVFEGGLPIVRNAGRARGRGLESSLTFTADSRIDLTLAAAFLDATYTRFRFGESLDYTGNRLPLAPKASGRVGVAVHDLPGLDGLSLQADYVYRSLQYFSPDNGVLRQPAHGLLSARIAYQIPRSGLEIVLSGENLTNSRYATTGQVIDAVNVAVLRLGEPRRIAVGARLQW